MTATTKALPKRSEVPVADTWDLASLYPDDAAWEADFAKLKATAEEYPKFAGTLGRSAADLAACLDFDNGFEGWKGPARIRDEKVSLQLTSSLPYLVVYTPQHKDYFCIEPVSHVGNAIHMADPVAHGLRALPPGESFDASMTLDVSVL